LWEWQPPQEQEEWEWPAEPEARAFEVVCEAHTEKHFSTLELPHSGHFGLSDELRMSSSNRSLHLVQSYS